MNIKIFLQEKIPFFPLLFGWRMNYTIFPIRFRYMYVLSFFISSLLQFLQPFYSLFRIELDNKLSNTHRLVSWYAVALRIAGVAKWVAIETNWYCSNCHCNVKISKNWENCGKIFFIACVEKAKIVIHSVFSFLL